MTSWLVRMERSTRRDTGIRFDAKGGMSHPGVDQIFKIVAGSL
jgi:hypothetical protein